MTGAWAAAPTNGGAKWVVLTRDDEWVWRERAPIHIRWSGRRQHWLYRCRCGHSEATKHLPDTHALAVAHLTYRHGTISAGLGGQAQPKGSAE